MPSLVKALGQFFYALSRTYRKSPRVLAGDAYYKPTKKNIEYFAILLVVQLLTFVFGAVMLAVNYRLFTRRPGFWLAAVFMVLMIPIGVKVYATLRLVVKRYRGYRLYRQTRAAVEATMNSQCSGDGLFKFTNGDGLYLIQRVAKKDELALAHITWKDYDSIELTTPSSLQFPTPIYHFAPDIYDVIKASGIATVVPGSAGESRRHITIEFDITGLTLNDLDDYRDLLVATIPELKRLHLALDTVTFHERYDITE